MLGHKLYQVLSREFPDTWVLLRQKLGALTYKNIFDREKTLDGVDLKNFDQLISVLNELKPDVILNAAGITIRRGINGNVSDSVLLNAALPHILEEWVSLNRGRRLIHISTDCVFSGKSGSYTEDDLEDASDYYGRSKLLGEVKGPQALTLRSSIIGREIANHTELIEWFLSQNGKTVKGFNSAIYSGVTTVWMAGLLKRIVRDFPILSGLYHVSSDPISKYDLLVLVKNIFGLDIEILKDEQYSSRKDLLSERFFHDTGIAKPQWEDMILEMKEDSLLYQKYYKN